MVYPPTLHDRETFVESLLPPSVCNCEVAAEMEWTEYEDVDPLYLEVEKNLTEKVLDEDRYTVLVDR